MSKSTRLTEIIYLLWSLPMTGYWLVLFENLLVPAVVPFGIASVLLIVFAWGMLRQHNNLKKIALVLSFTATIVFSVLAWKLQPACDCYHFSFLDLVPNGISICMLIVLWGLLRTKR